VTSSHTLTDVERLRRSLPPYPELFAKALLVLVSGLPGTGKSHFARVLSKGAPLLILETDVLRKILVADPTYSPEESARLFRACHSLAEELLRAGVPVLLDATNLVERNRERLYHIAEMVGAKLIIVQVEAPPEVVLKRLEGRERRVNPEDTSTANWQVYKKMKHAQQHITRNHFTVDTSKPIEAAVAKIAREINRWLRS